MRRILLPIFCAGLALAVTSCATRYKYTSAGAAPSPLAAPASAGGAEPGWPLRVVSGPHTAKVYAPEIDSWDGHSIIGRSAVEIQPASPAPPIYGVVALKAITLVNKESRTASLADMQVIGAQFPSAPHRAQYFQQMLSAAVPKEGPPIALPHLETSFSLPPQQLAGAGQPLDNTPPEIICATRPALLVSIDGPPAYRPVPSTLLQRVINCRFLLLKDSAGRFYLRLWNGYMTAPALAGPWKVADRPVPGADKAEAEAMAQGAVDLMQGTSPGAKTSPPALTSSDAPAIFVATRPAELIIFSGEPDFVPIPGTDLLYAENTTGDVFKLLSGQRVYVLITGRWFSAPSMSGPWQFVPGSLLPPDFANIPDTSPKENVKASVPGTPQAAEALIANSVPDSTQVPRTATMQNPQIDGSPQLQPIEGTPLYYVANSGTPIIRVDPQSWYACQNGVWFVATSLNGPWIAATSVPAVIYSIPVTSPLHYLTYVQVYGATPQYVYEGYTPGYLGTDVEDGVVVYGTGYWYPPWLGDVWYAGPITYGCGWNLCWTPWNDWCFGPGFGWGWGLGFVGWNCLYPPGPFWGPFRHWPGYRGQFAAHGGAGFTTAANLFSRPGRGVPLRPGFTGMYGRAYNSRTGLLAAGQSAAVQDVYASRSARGGFPANWQNRGSLSPAARSMSAHMWHRGGSFGFPYASRPASAYHGFGGTYGGFHEGGYGGFHGGGFGGFHGGGFGGGGHGGGGGHR